MRYSILKEDTDRDRLGRQHRLKTCPDVSVGLSVRGDARRCRGVGDRASSVSRQIAQLEAQLAIQLVERGRRGVRATEAGKLLLQHLRNQMDELETVLSEFDALRGLRRGQVVIAIGDGFEDCNYRPSGLFCDLCRLGADRRSDPESAGIDLSRCKKLQARGTIAKSASAQ